MLPRIPSTTLGRLSRCHPMMMPWAHPPLLKTTLPSAFTLHTPHFRRRPRRQPPFRSFSPHHLHLKPPTLRSSPPTRRCTFQAHRRSCRAHRGRCRIRQKLCQAHRGRCRIRQKLCRARPPMSQAHLNMSPARQLTFRAQLASYQASRRRRALSRTHRCMCQAHRSLRRGRLFSFHRWCIRRRSRRRLLRRGRGACGASRSPPCLTRSSKKP